MKSKPGITGIDSNSWQVTLLPLPKGFSRGSAYGFCNGQPVGIAEKLRSNTPTHGCWWPGGKPELLSLKGQEHVKSGRAQGDVIPGHWQETSGSMRAAVWRYRDGALVASALHGKPYEQTWATAVGGGAIAGMGKTASTPGQRALTVGLLWRDGAEPAVVGAEGDVAVYATDGTRVAGSVRGLGMLWPSPGAAPVELTPTKMQMSEVQALDGEFQVGAVFKGFRARAALWRGTAESFVDLTPAKFETGRVAGAAHGYQVGFIRQKDTTRDGSGGSDNRAVIWQGAADRWFDLNALLPSDRYNASSASAIDIRGDVVQVCGQAIRYELYHPGTPQESHAVPVAHPVLWTARLTP